MSHHWLAIGGWGIKIGIEHALIVGELQLAGRRIANIEAGLPKKALKAARVGTHDPAHLLVGYWRSDAGHRRRKRRLRHDRGTTSGQQQHERQANSGQTGRTSHAQP